MMYFSKEELLIVKLLLENLFDDGLMGPEEEDLYIKVKNKLESME